MQPLANMSVPCNIRATVFFFLNKRDFDPWVKCYATMIENRAFFSSV